jgi:polar amino acid transport system substrate-binding protein
MKKYLLLATAIGAVMISQIYVPSQGHFNTANATQESVFDRVIRTNTLRCAYATWAPGFYVDPKTGEKKGFSVEIAEAIGKKLDLKISWAEETGWGTAEQGFTTGRYDAMCAHVCFDARRQRAATFAQPFLIEPLVVMVRADDTRFDDDTNKINDADLTVAVMRGSILEYMAKDYAPRAKVIDLSELGSQTDMFMALTSKKIDFAFNTGVSAENYAKANPGKIRIISQPLRHCNAGFLLPLGDERLKAMIDGATKELLANGTIDEILSRSYGANSKHWASPSISFPRDRSVISSR